MRALILACLLAFPAMASTAESSDNETEEKLRSLCKDKWSTDYEMQKYCIDNQIEAVRGVKMIWDQYDEGAEERAIINRCMNKWTDNNDRPDWEMVEYCTNNQIEAYEAVQ